MLIDQYGHSVIYKRDKEAGCRCRCHTKPTFSNVSLTCSAVLLNLFNPLTQAPFSNNRFTSAKFPLAEALQSWSTTLLSISVETDWLKGGLHYMQYKYLFWNALPHLCVCVTVASESQNDGKHFDMDKSAVIYSKRQQACIWGSRWMHLMSAIFFNIKHSSCPKTRGIGYRITLSATRRCMDEWKSNIPYQIVCTFLWC